jgi:hypothetical protein
MKTWMTADSKAGKKRNRGSALSCVEADRGIALVMVLILSAISLGIMAALVYMLTVGTQASGLHKRYRNALDAGKSGAEITYDLLAARGNPNISGLPVTIPAQSYNTGGAGTGDCLIAKLNTKTADWGACDASVSIDPSNQATYDWSFQLGEGSQTYTVYAKIVDTVEGNSAGSIGLTKGGVVSTNSGEITVMSRPYLYTLEVDAQRSTNPQERAKYSILYQY